MCWITDVRPCRYATLTELILLNFNDVEDNAFISPGRHLRKVVDYVIKIVSRLQLPLSNGIYVAWETKKNFNSISSEDVHGLGWPENTEVR